MLFGWKTSELHGPARAWYSNGQLKLEGNFEFGMKQGNWTSFDSQGRISERGSYRDGFREGTWTIFNSAAGQMETIEFIADRPKAEFERLVAELNAEIASDQLDRQIVAMHRVDELGEAGVPLLARWLDYPQPDVSLMALRRLERLATIADEEGRQLPGYSSEGAISVLESLSDASDPRSARLAMVWLFRESPAHRAELYDRLIDSARESRDDAWRSRVLSNVYNCDPSRRNTTFIRLAHADRDWVPPARSGWGGSDGSPYVGIAERCEDLESTLRAAMDSPDAVVRRFVLLVLRQRAIRRPARIEEVSPGAKQMRYTISDDLSGILKRGKSDSDPNVSSIAETIDQLIVPQN